LFQIKGQDKKVGRCRQFSKDCKDCIDNTDSSVSDSVDYGERDGDKRVPSMFEMCFGRKRCAVNVKSFAFKHSNKEKTFKI
jgi:hypothetical protein